MNNSINDVLMLLEKIHGELVEVSTLCDAGDKYLIGESISIERIRKLIAMEITGIKRHITFTEDMAESEKRIAEIDDQLKKTIEERNSLLKMGESYGIPKQNEGETTESYLQRLTALTNQSHEYIYKLLCELKLAHSDPGKDNIDSIIDSFEKMKNDEKNKLQ